MRLPSSGRAGISEAEETNRRILDLFVALREKHPEILCFLMFVAEKTGVTHAATSNFDRESPRARRYAEEFGGECFLTPGDYDSLCRKKFFVRAGANHGPPIAEKLFDDDKSTRLLRLTLAGMKVVMYLRTRPTELARLKATFGKAKAKLVPPFTSTPTDKVQYAWGTAETIDGKSRFAGELSFACLRCGKPVMHQFNAIYPDERFTVLILTCKCSQEWIAYLFEPNRAPDPNG